MGKFANVLLLMLGLFGLSAWASPTGVPVEPKSQTEVPIQPKQSDCVDMPDVLAAAYRIVGGNMTQGPLPYQVAIRRHNTLNPFCGGTIIHPEYVVSAAHCIPPGSNLSNFDLVAGLYQIRGPGSQSRKAEVAHYFSFDSITNDNDIVVLKVNRPFNFSSNDVGAACLPSAQPTSGEICFASGWGTLAHRWPLRPTVLQYVGVRMLSNTQCRATGYGSSQITDSMVCAASQGKDSCLGDSGGPLVCNVNGKAVLTGVISWGTGCAFSRYPGVHARVFHFLSEINAILNVPSTTVQPPVTTDAPTQPSTTTDAPTGPTDATIMPPTTGPPVVPARCKQPELYQDRVCDSENNVENCNYDGGDCCGPHVDASRCPKDKPLGQCKCKDPSHPCYGDN